MDRELHFGILTLVCATTGGEVGTGVEYTKLELTETSRVTLYEHCPFCDEAHLFKFADARLVADPLGAHVKSPVDMVKPTKHRVPADAESIMRK